MAEPIILTGQSGAGKSRSMINLDPKRTLIVNVCGKRFPFPAKFGFVMKTMNVETIKAQLRKMPGCIKTVVIDDAGYLMTDAFMKGHTSGDQFKLYNSIADSMYTLVNFIKNELPEDVLVYIVMHEERTEDGSVKLRTIGKLLDQKVCLEGMVTICLRAMATKDGRHIFRTQSDGADVAKSPEGMFDDIEIPNDLKMVDDRIRAYWGIEDLPDTPKKPIPPKATVTTATTVPAA